MSKECTLSNKELLLNYEEWVSKLAKTGGRAWSLQVPVNFNRDPDMLFLELAERFKKSELTPGAQVFSTERIKQINHYGFSIKYSKDHPEYYADGQMVYAARILSSPNDLSKSIPKPKNWDYLWWRRLLCKDHKERLEIAGAFLIAEYERLYIEEK